MRGLAQVVAVDGQYGVPDVERLRLVSGQALENLRDEDGHLVFLPTCWQKGRETEPLGHTCVTLRRGRAATIILVY